jgi:hypothetical protein
MTYFDKFLMQGLSKYYIKKFVIKKKIEDFFKNISKIILKYFLKSNHKYNKKGDGCASCYPICTSRIFQVGKYCHGTSSLEH